MYYTHVAVLYRYCLRICLVAITRLFRANANVQTSESKYLLFCDLIAGASGHRELPAAELAGRVRVAGAAAPHSARARRAVRAVHALAHDDAHSVLRVRARRDAARASSDRLLGRRVRGKRIGQRGWRRRGLAAGGGARDERAARHVRRLAALPAGQAALRTPRLQQGRRERHLRERHALDECACRRLIF